MKIPKDKWIWMPHPAHFICAKDCNFVLATRIGKYIVSTVGEYWPDQAVRRIHAEIDDLEWYKEHKDKKGDNFDYEYMSKFGYEDIGCDRKYETMVFDAIKCPKTTCCPYSINVQAQHDERYYNTAEDAYKGHMQLCRKYANK